MYPPPPLCSCDLTGTVYKRMLWYLAILNMGYSAFALLVAHARPTQSTHRSKLWQGVVFDSSVPDAENDQGHIPDLSGLHRFPDRMRFGASHFLFQLGRQSNDVIIFTCAFLSSLLHPSNLNGIILVLFLFYFAFVMVHFVSYLYHTPFLTMVLGFSHVLNYNAHARNTTC